MVSFVSLLVSLALIGFVLWIVVTYVPMPEPFRRAVIVLVVLAVVLAVARMFIGDGLFIWPRR